ncbi:FtsQ-type POTRA domain-containing protein [Aquihabitans sp. G128]|uniref:cell division protein FtsQ/DivIB n=1 Tax=Aquihabitans sp. G128 TaxID=2849779 RepID=UPI001C2242B0|nr:FtsQ-type POTRA domain-containing protein [Aquihabitans sp. G128]QXC62268.1 FtsQ-type POTRA domain-containing protein [Aquihabitans sp. G128]
MSSGLLTRGGPPSAPEASPLIDPRLAARRAEVARDRGRRRLRRLLALAVVTVLVLAAVGLTRSTALDVDHVRVAGATHSGADTVRTRAGIPTGRAMTSVDLGAATRRIEELPWVADATVVRHWPGTVAIDVTERVAVAVAGDGPGAVLVDRDGRILGSATGGSLGLPTAGPDPIEGPGSFLPAARRPLVALLADLPVPLRSQVDRGLLVEGGYGLLLDDGIRVDLGGATRLRAKSEAVLGLLQQADRRTLATIDVTVPGAAALTRKKGPEA